MLKGATTSKKEKTEAAVATQPKRKYQKSAAQMKKEAEAKAKRLAVSKEKRKKQAALEKGSKNAKAKQKKKAVPVRSTRSTRSASATTRSATTRSKRKRTGGSSDSSSSDLSDVESPTAKRRIDARRILEAEAERKRAERAKEQADTELRAAQKAANDLEQKAREAAVRAEAAARAAEAARTPAKSPRAGSGGGGPAAAPLEMWKVYICWRDEELPVKIRSDATVGSLAWLISSKTDGKLQADRCELTFGVTKLASVPSQELLATIGVVQGARFHLTLRPKGAAPKQAPSPVLSPRAKASAKARLAAARGVERAAMARLDASRGARVMAKGRAPNQSWTEAEALALVDGIAAFGLGEWARILDAVWLKRVDFPKRSATDLKDKWRNLCNSADKPPGFKFRLAYVTPELLGRTRAVRDETRLKKMEDVEKWEAQLAARRAEIRRRSLNA